MDIGEGLRTPPPVDREDNDWNVFQPYIWGELDLSKDHVKVEPVGELRRSPPREQEPESPRRPRPRHRLNAQEDGPSQDARRHRTPPRMDWQEEVAHEQPDRGEDPATGQDHPIQQQPGQQDAMATPPRRSGRTRQPPQWYTPPPQ